MSEKISSLPWILANNGCHVYDANANIIASVALDGSWGDVNDRTANANYIITARNAFPGLVEALEKATRELNVIRARDGVPYCYDGYKSDVCPDYFSSVVDECFAALAAAKQGEK